MDDDRIPIIAVHRGIGIHDNQTPTRLKVVKAAIDQVANMGDVMALVDFAADPRAARSTVVRRAQGCG